MSELNDENKALGIKGNKNTDSKSDLYTSRVL
ncbi:hypothetical protein Acal01_03205 [Acinetobacter calcoaceticus]